MCENIDKALQINIALKGKFLRNFKMTNLVDNSINAGKHDRLPVYMEFSGF